MWHHLLIYCYLFVKDVHYSWLDWSRHSMTAEIIESDTHRRMSWLSLTLVDRWVNRHGHSSRAELIHSDTHCRRPSWLMRYSSSTFEWINTATHHSVKSGLMQIPVYNWINWSRITRLARSRYSSVGEWNKMAYLQAKMPGIESQTSNPVSTNSTYGDSTYQATQIFVELNGVLDNAEHRLIIGTLVAESKSDVIGFIMHRDNGWV